MRREAVGVLQIEMVGSPEDLKEQKWGLGQGSGWAQVAGSVGRGAAAW